MSRLVALGAAGLLATAPAAAPAFTIRAPAVVEASGLGAGIRAAHTFYVQNDSGDSARFFAVDARTGRLRTTFRVPAATNHDWEDLAVATDAGGTPSVWLADIGDNDAVREEVQLYRVDEPAAVRGGHDTTRPDVWRLRYPSGPVDAESLFVTPQGRAYVVTKVTSGRSTVYAVPPHPNASHVQTLRRVGTIAPLLTTGATMSRDGSVLAVRTYFAAYLWHVGRSGVVAALRTRPTVVPLPLQRQGEGICIVGRALYIDSEGLDQPVWRVPLPRAFGAAVRPSTPARSTPAPSHPLTSRVRPGRSKGPTARGVALSAGVLVLLVLVVFATFRRRRHG